MPLERDLKISKEKLSNFETRKHLKALPATEILSKALAHCRKLACAHFGVALQLSFLQTATPLSIGRYGYCQKLQRSSLLLQQNIL